MKKRLGAIPKGLEWISQNEEQGLSAPATAKINLGQFEISAAKRGLQKNLTRATFIMQQEHLDKIKSYAYWQRVQIKDVLEHMCEQFFKDKVIRSIPEKRKDL